MRADTAVRATARRVGRGGRRASSDDDRRAATEALIRTVVERISSGDYEQLHDCMTEFVQNLADGRELGASVSISVGDWDAMTGALAVQAPWWQPGTAHGYHGVTFGHLVGEVLRRATGRTCGALIRDELAAPLGVDLSMPLPVIDDQRTAQLVVDTSSEGTFFDRWDPKTSLGPRSFGNPPDCNDPPPA